MCFNIYQQVHLWYIMYVGRENENGDTSSLLEVTLEISVYMIIELEKESWIYLGVLWK